MNDLLMFILLTFAPLFELRASIPFAIATGMHWFLAIVLAIVFNWIIAIIVWFLLHRLLTLISKIAFFKKYIDAYYARIQKKIDFYVDKYGVLALALFIAVPIPGSGVYSGAIAGTIIGADTKQFLLASLIGVTIAAIIVTALSVGFFATCNCF